MRSLKKMFRGDSIECSVPFFKVAFLIMGAHIIQPGPLFSPPLILRTYMTAHTNTRLSLYIVSTYYNISVKYILACLVDDE